MNAPSRSRRELVAQTHVGEGAAHHHFVIAAPRSVGVEVRRLHAVCDQVLSRRAGRLDGAGRRDVIGGHAVAEVAEHARAGDVLHRSRVSRHVLEVRRILHVGGLLVPREGLALGHGKAAPALIALEDIVVTLLEEIAGNVFANDRVHFFGGRPNVLQEHRRTLAIFREAQRLV